ncbi:membrane protein implicated in regulation of membrane protease activity [Synechococcus sp. PCC 7502]|uniref:NfeD family protein n=1 Tax=Synechococcus sp. PCC 7502 TaxID=1173263 RepID=UPI00029FD02B|nr:NfeD family protein [Synechococcus sp. PCC 7502]AFY73760.1 membrane protein implicated in regulation of membrane protease activity [Synechococcus sp. PCC 7502]
MLTAKVVWFALGITLLVLELLVPIPTLLLAGVLGIGALVVAAILLVGNIPIALQLLIWVLISGFLGWYSRRFIPKGLGRIRDADEAVTIAEILPGQAGRVKYEGNSWKARCDDPKTAIAINQKVYVLRRQGTTLIVMPEHWLQEH